MSFTHSNSISSRIDFLHRNYSGSSTQLGPCLLISRETGAGGSEIGRRFADALGWRLMDKSILDQLSSQYGTSRAVLDMVDERKVTWLADIFHGWIEGHGFSQLAYVHRLHRLFQAAAMQGDVVIVGRGARFILPRSSSFSVRIVAPLRQRVERIKSSTGLSDHDARIYIETVDSQRTAFLERYFHHDVTDPDVHDLVINTEQLGVEGATNTLISAFQLWECETYPRGALTASRIAAN
jgi:hypothetical protein